MSRFADNAGASPMPGTTGAVVQAWRRSMGWDIPETARRLRVAAGNSPLPAHGSLVRMIRRWERTGSGVSERYELLYRNAMTEHSPAVTLGASGALARLTSADLASRQDRQQDRAPVTGDDALIYAVERAAFGGPSPVTALGGQPGGVQMRHVRQIEQVTAAFRRWDNEYGGGLRRKAVIGQLSEVCAMLDGPFPDEQTARHLFATVADLAQLAGWMSWDLQMHATAQRYYMLGLNLARNAGDRTQVTRLLYCLARQMVDLERPREALNLASAGAYVMAQHSTPRAAALIRIAEARAYACLGDAASCHVALGAAQEQYSLAGPATDPGWCSFFDEGELCGLIGVALRDLALADSGHAVRYAAEARSWIEKAVAARSQAFMRSKVLDMDGLAVVSLLTGEPDRAAELAASAIDLSQQVSSPRAATRMRLTLQLGQQRFPDAAPWGDLRGHLKALPPRPVTM